ncbi:MAG TPA: sigma 54-interacting transcriptional regulator [Blastocatellia bacterium]|nr:sigma 54-interacting transcriptional regulator [Blastocatellia bacterium]
MGSRTVVQAPIDQTALRGRMRVVVVTESLVRSREIAHLLEPVGCRITPLIYSEAGDGAFSGSESDLVVAEIPEDDPSVLHQLRGQSGVPIVALVPERLIGSAMELARMDHCRFLLTPAHPREILEVVRDQLDLVALRQTTSWLTDQLRARYHPDNLIGVSRGAHNRRAFVRAFADVDLPILLVGERGVGKETVARTLHYASRRALLPFLLVDTEALPTGGLEPLLFGNTMRPEPHAPVFRPGLMELARGGTIYLTDIARIPQIVQMRLATLLREQHSSGDEPRVRPRLIFGSLVSPDSLRRQRLLDEDLWLLLQETQLTIEPLRQRQEDIPLFVEAFTGEICREFNKEPREITPGALEALKRYSWPENVSQLKKTLLAAFERARPPAIDETMLPEPIGTRPSPVPKMAVTEAGLDFYEVVEEFERALISSALHLTAGNQRRAARLLRLKETTLAAMRKRLFPKSGEGK